MRLSDKLLGQGHVKERLKSSLMKFYGRYGDLIKKNMKPSLPNVTWHSVGCPYAVTPSIDKTLQQFVTLLPNWTLLPNLHFYPIARGFHGTFVTGWHANSWRSLLRTSGPVQLWDLRVQSFVTFLFSEFWFWNSNVNLCIYFTFNSFRNIYMVKNEVLSSSSIFKVIRQKWQHDKTRFI